MTKAVTARSWSPADSLHPVRIRLAQILALGPRTGTQLRQALPHVPYSSLYRHIRWLVDAGVIHVVGERKVRGAVEHTYELDERAVQGAVPGPADRIRHQDMDGHPRHAARGRGTAGPRPADPRSPPGVHARQRGRRPPSPLATC
nr:helix-turn-helix domain-containing protein [Nonomuraea diastatica]